MAFECSTQGATLDFHKPYRAENQFRFARGLVLTIAGIGLLVMARGAGSAVGAQGVNAAQGGFALLVLGGAVLVVLGILELARAARRLRVFFGRGQPTSLVPDVPRDVHGTSPAAQQLVEQLRHGAIPLAEPRGALNGILYSLSRHLVTAPRVLRECVQARFANLLACGGLLLLSTVTWFITPNPAAQALAAANQLAGPGAPLHQPPLAAQAVAPALSAAAADCTACGAPLAPEMRFCGRCGTPVAPPAAGGDVDLAL